MSTLPDNEFDLEKLFLPAWASEASASKYAHYEGETERPERRDRRGPRPPRREGGPGGGRDENRDRRGTPREGNRRGPQSGERRGQRRPDERERREPPAPLPDIAVALLPEEKGVEFLARQVRMTGRAYPLFEIAQMILQKPERHIVEFSVKKNAEGQPLQPLFLCALDDTLWLSEDEAVAHVLRKHFSTFYQAERTPTEPPKGKYTFVAQCGISGVILGPPNYHDYQNQLRKLHAERFSRMPFDLFKSRVKIVRDDEVVKKWIEDQSFKTEYICLNMPESLHLPNMEAVEKHFRENHKDIIIKPVEAHKLTGAAARNLRSPQLVRLVRSAWEDQRRFPLQIATVLSQQFARHGLQFFKVNKTVTHVSVARPHYLDLEAIPVSQGVRQIVDYINSHPKCTRRQLVEALAPSPATPAETPASPPAAPAEPGQADEARPHPAPVPEAAGPTPEQTAVIADLHWLIHQGHVIEFANGILETAKKPVPRPLKPQAKPGEKNAEAAQGEAAAPITEPVPPPEGAAASADTSPSTETPPPAAEAAPAPEPPPDAQTTPREPEAAPVPNESAAAPAEPPPGAPADTVHEPLSQCPGEPPPPFSESGPELVRPSDSPAAKVLPHEAQPGPTKPAQPEEPPREPAP